MTWLAPAWLLGLVALLPLWWLHRVLSRGRRVRVASVLHWPESPGADAADPGGARRLDLPWLRRAGIVALLVLGLAAPALPLRAPPLTVWFDPAASLGTVENGARRIDTALELLARRVGARGTAEVEVRSLGDPALALELAAPFTGLAARLATGAPNLPERTALDPAAEHWVVTDGATPAVNDWIARMPVSGVVAVGAATENVALTGLAARPALGERDRLDVEIRVVNAGLAPAERLVTLSAAGAERWSAPVALAPGGVAALRTTLAGAVLPLTARLTPGDALAADDVLALEADRPLLVGVAVDLRCGTALRAALAAHPRLVPADGDRPASLAVDCGGLGPGVAPTVLRIRARGAPRLLSSPATWTGSATLPPAVPLRARDALDPERTGDRRLLEAGGEPLLVRRAAPSPVVDTSLDLDDPALTRQPQFPLLVEQLVDAALGRRLLGELPGEWRAAETANIAPRRHWPERLGPTPRVPGATLALGPWLLVLALGLALVDLALGAAGLLREARYYRGEAP